MSKKRFCRTCMEKTDHDYCVGLLHPGENDGIATRIFFGVMSLGASEVMADRVYKCQQCGRRTAA